MTADRLWRTLRIEQCCTHVTSGGTPSRKNPDFFRNGTVPWVKTGELKDLVVDPKRIGEWITEQALEKSSAKLLPKGTVLMAMYGDGQTIGSLGLVQSPVSCNQACCAMIPDPAVCDGRFLFYAIRDYRNAWIKIAHGGAQRNLSGSIIRQREIAVPSLYTQQRIASILSAYDDLIENGKRRIAILEEMAWRLYEEWFIHFHFPGQEGVVLNGELPAGWTREAFSSIAQFINGYAFKPTDWSDEGVPIVKIKELKGGIKSDTPRFQGDIPDKYKIEDGHVLFSWSADLEAYIWQGGPAWLNQHLFNVVPVSEISRLYLFFALRSQMPEFRARSAGTTMRHIKRSALDQVFAVRPPQPVHDAFVERVRPCVHLILNLTKKIANLRDQRDLLLPKLVSGEINVSEVERELEAAE